MRGFFAALRMTIFWEGWKRTGNNGKNRQRQGQRRNAGVLRYAQNDELFDDSAQDDNVFDDSIAIYELF